MQEGTEKHSWMEDNDAEKTRGRFVFLILPAATSTLPDMKLASTLVVSLFEPRGHIIRALFHQARPFLRRVGQRLLQVCCCRP